jgi:hypothetical protein
MKRLEKRVARIESERPSGTIILDDDWPIPEQRGLEAPADIWSQIMERCAAVPRDSNFERKSK